MKTVSLTPRTESVPFAELAKALATKALELLTSQRLSIVLGIAALVAVLWYDATGTHAAWLAVTVTLWAAQLCAMAAIDIEKGGAL